MDRRGARIELHREKSTPGAAETHRNAWKPSGRLSGTLSASRLEPRRRPVVPAAGPVRRDHAEGGPAGTLLPRILEKSAFTDRNHGRIVLLNPVKEAMARPASAMPTRHAMQGPPSAPIRKTPECEALPP
jgi:hypothetical protein